MKKRKSFLVEVDSNFIRVDNKFFNDAERALEEIKRKIRKL